jgi:N-acetylglucosamine-6-sulfatase
LRFTDLAGTQTPSYVDGRSLRPVLEEKSTTWRSTILLEAHRTPDGGSTRAYYGVRKNTGRKYIEYEGGVRELYNLGADPYEVANRLSATTPPNALQARLRALKNCSTDTRRTAENGQ